MAQTNSSLRTNKSSPPVKAYRVQLTGGQLFMVAILFLMSLGVTFYLGWVVGKSLRNPNSAVPVVEVPPEANSSTKATPNALNFFDLGEQLADTGQTLNLSQLEKLKENTERLQKEQIPAEKATETTLPSQKLVDKPVEAVPTTQNIEKTEKKEEQVETVNAPESTKASPNESTKALLPEIPEPPLEPRKPAKTEAPEAETRAVARPQEASAEATGDLYTLQVFSSKNKETAEDFAGKLRKNGFNEATVQIFETPNHDKLFRVRVGRMSREKAETLAQRLKQLSFVESVQITRL